MSEKPSFEACPHHTPNAGGSVASELHGVCIFCWRDWWGAERTKRLKLEAALKNLLAIIDSPEWQGTMTYAHVHGWEVNKDIAIRNGDWIQEARDLVKEED